MFCYLLHDFFIMMFKAYLLYNFFNQSLLFLLNAACLVNINFIVFGLTWSELEPMIYRTRSEHSNHNTTDAVLCGVVLIKILTILLISYRGLGGWVVKIVDLWS
jgi:hypothetical protein